MTEKLPKWKKQYKWKEKYKYFSTDIDDVNRTLDTLRVYLGYDIKFYCKSCGKELVSGFMTGLCKECLRRDFKARRMVKIGDYKCGISKK